MNKNMVAIICASIGGIALIGTAVIGLIGKNQPEFKPEFKIVVQQTEELPQPQSMPDKKGKALLPSKEPHSARPATERTVSPQRPQGNDKSEHPLTLYCACKANQTFCFRSEMECQKYSPVYGCSQKFSDMAAFNVFDKNKWKEYGNGWVHEIKCVIDERRD